MSADNLAWLHVCIFHLYVGLNAAKDVCWLVFGACYAPSEKCQDGICSVVPPWFFSPFVHMTFSPSPLAWNRYLLYRYATPQDTEVVQKMKTKTRFFWRFSVLSQGGGRLKSLIRNRFRRIVMCLWLYIVMMSCPFAVLMVSKPPHASSSAVAAQTFLIKCPFE